MCTSVGREGCPCWLFKAPLLFMFGNLRNRVKEGEKAREGGWRQTEARGFTLPLRGCTECDMRSIYITLMKLDKLKKKETDRRLPN